jgi:hypothetical protein
MRIRLTSLILVLMLSGSAFAGVPVEFGEQSCSMDHAMGYMDCCKAALMPSKDASDCNRAPMLCAELLEGGNSAGKRSSFCSAPAANRYIVSAHSPSVADLTINDSAI